MTQGYMLEGRSSVSTEAEKESGKLPRWRRRLRSHLLLAGGSTLFTAAFFQIIASSDAVFKLSLASGYAALVLLALSLLIVHGGHGVTGTALLSTSMLVATSAYGPV